MKKRHFKENEQIVVVCPVKNDNEYLIEFTDHYLNLGFDKVILLDNNDDDSIMPSNILSNYLKKGYVKILDCRNTNFNDTLFKYSFFCNYNFDWVLFADDDEFLELKKHHSIRDFLNTFKPEVTKIVLNNMHYGDNNQIFQRPGNVQERFPEPLPLDLSMPDDYGPIIHNSAVKSILKKKKVEDFKVTSHCLIDNMPNYNADNQVIELEQGLWRVGNDKITYETAYIKHYCTKSLEEFVKCKVKRSQSNCSRYENRFKFDNYYFMFNKRTQEKEKMVDYFTQRYLS